MPDRPESCDLAPYGQIVDAFDELLGEQGISIAATHLVGRIEAGAPWTNLTGSVRGALPDPTASRVAVAQVLGGRAIRASRDEPRRL